MKFLREVSNRSLDLLDDGKECLTVIFSPYRLFSKMSYKLWQNRRFAFGNALGEKGGLFYFLEYCEDTTNLFNIFKQRLKLLAYRQMLFYSYSALLYMVLKEALLVIGYPLFGFLYLRNPYLPPMAVFVPAAVT